MTDLRLLVRLIDADATHANVTRERPDLRPVPALAAADWEYVVWLDREAARAC